MPHAVMLVEATQLVTAHGISTNLRDLRYLWARAVSSYDNKHACTSEDTTILCCKGQHWACACAWFLLLSLQYVRVGLATGAGLTA